jgi:hypothetical protein
VVARRTRRTLARAALLLASCTVPYFERRFFATETRKHGDIIA